MNNQMRSSRSSCRAGTKAPIVPPLGKHINARAPDVSVACCPPSPEGTFIDPVLIVEVMSPTNEADTWESIHALAGLKSLQEVLVAYSTRVEIQLFNRDAQGAWLRDPQTSTSLSDTLQLRSIGLELPVSDIYFGTPLEK